MRSRLTIAILMAFMAVMPASKLAARSDVCDCSNIHTVAVMSAIGGGLGLKSQTFLKAGDRTLKIDDWNVDDQVESTVRQLLGRRFDFKNVSYDRSALGDVASGLLSNTRNELKKYLATVNRDGIDGFIIVRPARRPPVPGDRGLSVTDDVTDDGHPVASANYEIHIVDARTLDLLATYPSVVLLRPGNPGPAAFVIDKRLTFNADTMTPTPEQLRAYQAVFYKLIPLSLLETIRALQLGAILPPSGARSLAARPPGMRPFGKIKSVALVSTIGDDFLLQHFGDSNLTASADHLNIDDWSLDSVVETAAREAIKNEFEVKDIPVDRAEVRKSRLLDDKLAFAPDIHGLSPTDEVDAYLVFFKHPFTFRNSRTRGQGAGMVRFFNLLNSDTIIFMYYDVALIDARTLKVIQAHSAVVDPAYSLKSPSIAVQGTLWPDSADKMTADQREKIHAAITRLLGWTEKETLLRMDLTDKMIVDSWSLPVVDAIETDTL